MKHHIKFKRLDDLLMFLKACERGEGLGKTGRRSLYEHVHLDTEKSASARYAIEFGEDARWDGSGQLYGGVLVREQLAPGSRVHLNKLFQKLPLLNAGPQSFAQLPAIVIARPLAPDKSLQSIREDLYEARCEIAKLPDAESRFFFARNDQPNEGWLAVHITQVDPSFNWVPFQKAHPDITVFAPAWDEENCFLFVQSGFAYPKPTEFYYLYDETYESSHLLLCMAGKPANIPTGPHQQRQIVWNESIWHRVAEESYTAVEDLLNLEIDSSFPVFNWGQGEVDGSLQIPVQLNIGDRSRAIGSMNDLERRISAYERELEYLHAGRERLQSFTHQEFIPAYLFHQPANTDGLDGNLPEGMQAFLRKPLGELARYSYQAVTVEGGCNHFLLGDVRVSSGIALGTACTHVYLCDARWADWGLNLFVRSDCALNLAIDEQGVAEKVAELITLQGVDREAQFILAEPLLRSGEKIQSSDGLQFTVLNRGIPANQALRFTNEKSTVLPVVGEISAALISNAVLSHNLHASQDALELDQLLLERARQLIELAETEWERVRVRSQEICLKARITDIALRVTEDVYNQPPATWVEFVNQVLDTERKLAEMKINSIHAWTVSDQSRKEALEKVARAQLDVSREIELKKTEYGGKLAILRPENDRLSAKLKELESAREAVAVENRRLKDLKEKLQRENAALDAVIKDLSTQITACGQQRQIMEARRTERQQRQRELDAFNAELKTVTEKDAAEGTAFEAQVAALRSAKARIDAWLEQNAPQQPEAPRGKKIMKFGKR